MTDSRADLASSVERLAEGRVLCIGDLMLDRFVSGAVERISPEAPIPVLRVEAEDVMLGGAGNVVRNLLSLGGSCRFVSVVGEDADGDRLTAMLEGEGRVMPHLLRDPARRSTVKTRFVADGQQLLRTDSEAALPLSDELAARAAERIAGFAEGAGAVVLSDYGKGTLTPAVVGAALAAGEQAGVRVIVDPKGTDFGRYRGAAIVTPNRRELAEATRMPVGSDAEVVAAARHLIESFGFEAVLVTRSQEGMTLVSGGAHEASQHLPAVAREVFDVSGAGDTVIATFALGLAVGMPLRDAAELANAAAGIVVGKVGTATVRPAELIHALHTSEMEATDRKVAPAAAAAEILAGWRRRNARIGFTNGCFDLLHPGHVSLLRQARAACDRLVVGLNSDASVRRLKGDGRPVQSETARAMVLASLAAVDLVVVFAEDTPLRLIELLRPDVLIKGADYTIETVVGADVVQGYGGRVVLADLVPGHSTTETIARMGR
ncbi:MAG: bifunctional heptose 7-phosphate kinase/heptose 1-phosphate adenyltransferase [Rhodospirillaceae bacterium]|nr:bifunctional heptose 7-phosphate kinase/heptose 1-phosphate adenyltransferase [Rhodospirillaceae bacterium]